MGNVQQYIGKRLEVGKYQLEVVKYLGEGGSSFIFLVKDVMRESAKPMVLKRLVAENDATFALLQSEIDMHQRFRHAQVVEFYASTVVKKPRNEREVFILMEYCPQGHLHENMVKMGAKRFTERDLLRLFRSLCVPVSLLHDWDPPIAHRDLKLENFLLAQNGVYKLCDFGSCVEGPQSLETKADRAKQADHVGRRTTSMYRSPELADVEGTAMFGAGVLTEAVDIWAMGCVLYQMAFFKPPFPLEGLRTERYTIPKESKYSADLHQLIARMLQADVERRATIHHVIDCIDAMLEGNPLPKNEGAAAPASPRKTAPAVNKPAPASREGSFESSASAKKTTEARKETAPAAKKAPASDLLDMDFNPTISTPPAKAATSDPFGGGSAGWSGAAPPEAFANFAEFPSPSKFGAAVAPTSGAGGSSFDAFGFPGSPVKQPPNAGFASPPPAQGMPAPAPVAAVDPFEGLGGGGMSYGISGGAGGPGMGGFRPPQQHGMPPPQGFQHMMPQQQQMWGQQQQQQQWGHGMAPQQQQQWGQAQPQGGFPRGF